MPQTHAFSFLTRKPGPLTVLEVHAQTLLRRWVPKWHEVFYDPATPYFYERVGSAFKPQVTGQRRLLSQLRQLAMYSDAIKQRENFMFRPDLTRHVDALLSNFAGPVAGAWVYAVDDAGQALDCTQDLYGHAFVIFALAHYGSATGDGRAHLSAIATANYIDTAFRHGVAVGFTEALDETGTPIARLRRHESHMHLLEACLAAAHTWDDPIFMRLAGELVDLFLTRFYDQPANFLSEYYTDDLRPAPDAQTGRITCEAGHYYEWIWLLKKYGAAIGDTTRYDDICLSLLAWANQHGWDNQYGGIYDEVEVDGTIISDRKRIWPLTEGLKANALLLDVVPDRDATKDLMAAMARLLETSYIQQRGFWTEWLNRDLSQISDYMPATTPYHVYFGIMEARQALKWRGASMSWRLTPYLVALERSASTLMRRVRAKFL